MATVRAATTRHCHTDEISEDTYQPKYLPRQREGGGGGGASRKANDKHEG